ncbi:efflux RND transporter periplasmic adaptor subunit [Paenibacillus wulumuqiensis]|uniref:efflux RND transporter periplasmic adaptor subunit n=1 Tax=Paenibacillus wulumuqiensis TaxID=1567107 RepID=UPI0009E38CB1|nr:efflux RND transporter periplasmic adaptor subunit [Paenibacillus wulumuqiensis]
MAVTTLLLAVSLTACSAGEPAVQSASNSVEVTAAKQQPLNAVYDLSGTLTAYDETPVAFQTGGTVISVNGDIGDSVTKGSIMARLDTADLQLTLDTASEDVAAAQAALASSRASLSDARAGQKAAAAGVSSAQAKVESARISEQDVLAGARSQEKAQAQNAVNTAQTAYNQAKTEATRSQTLLDNGLLTQQEYEKAQTALADAETALKDAQSKLSLQQEGASQSERAQAAAAVKEAQVGIENAQASVAQANAAVEQAQASVQQSQAGYEQKLVAKKTAQLNLSRASLKAPASGVILTKSITVGQTVSAGGGTSAQGGSSPLFTIGEIDRLKVQLPIADSDIGQWKVGQQVSISLYDEIRTGKVTKLNPQTNESTGSINVEVVINNPQRDWKPGQVVNASRQVSAETGILLPTEAVISSGSEPYVFKAVNGKAVKTPVELGKMYNNSYQIIGGIKVGDKVVTRGADRLFNGDELTVSQAQGTAAQPAGGAASASGTKGEASAND